MKGDKTFYECNLCHKKVNSVFWHNAEDYAAGPWLHLCDRCHEEKKVQTGGVNGLRTPEMGNSSVGRLRTIGCILVH